jgi:hypothetical protein
MLCIAAIPRPMTQVEMQYRDHMQHIENKRLEAPLDDETSGSAEFSGAGE